MAENGRITVSEARVVSVDADPSTAGGVEAPVGSVALNSLDGTIWSKTGSADTAWKQLKAGEPGTGGGLNLLASVDLSLGATTIDFTTDIDDTYDVYWFSGTGLRSSASDVNFRSRVYVTGMVQSGATDYDYETVYHTDRNASSGSPYMEWTLNIGTTNIDNAAGDSFGFQMYLFSPANTGINTKCQWLLSHDAINGSTPRNLNGSGNYKFTSAVDGMQFFLSSGNFTAGDVRLYGLSI